MKRRMFKFLSYFLLFFFVNLLSNVVLKQELNVLTACAVALGVSGGMVFFGPYVYRKFGRS